MEDLWRTLERHGMAAELVAWARPYGSNAARAWRACERGEHLLAMVACAAPVEVSAVVEAAWDCARTALEGSLGEDAVPAGALDAAERQARGACGLAECNEWFLESCAAAGRAEERVRAREEDFEATLPALRGELTRVADAVLERCLFQAAIAGEDPGTLQAALGAAGDYALRRAFRASPVLARCVEARRELARARGWWHACRAVEAAVGTATSAEMVAGARRLARELGPRGRSRHGARERATQRQALDIVARHAPEVFARAAMAVSEAVAACGERAWAEGSVSELLPWVWEGEGGGGPWGEAEVAGPLALAARGMAERVRRRLGRFAPRGAVVHDALPCGDRAPGVVAARGYASGERA